MRRARRRARVLARSLLLHVLVLALVGLGLLARMSESSDAQLALAERSVALAQLDRSAAPAALPELSRGGPPPAARASTAPDGPEPPAPSSLDRAPLALSLRKAGGSRGAGGARPSTAQLGHAAAATD